MANIMILRNGKHSMGLKSIQFLIFVFFVTSMQNVLAQSNDDIRRFKKCYAVFTSQMIEVDHPLMMQVIAGTKTGTQACMELISSANLSDDNTIGKNASNEYDREKQRVFQNVHFMHRSFFSIVDYGALSDMVNLDTFTKSLFDINSDAYYWNYAFFKPEVKASNIVTANESYASIRFLPTDDADVQRQKRLTTGIAYTDYGSWIDIDTLLVDQGLLVGIKPDDRSFYADLVDNYWNSEMHGSNGNEHLGAGVIGSQVYMFGNFGRHGSRERSDGGDKMYRRWSQHVLGDLMCKDLPALRIEDVVDEVDSESPFFYRKSASCMQCHSTMDPMAAYARNIRTTGVSTPFRPFFAMKFEPTEPALETLLPFESDENYYLRPADGRLTYRSYDGTLVSETSTGMASLGQLLSESNDFYACTAQKYYKLLTGVDVDLNDIGSPTAVTLSPLAIQHRQRVINLGQQLKDDPNQNIQSIVQAIIDTNTFVNAEVF